MERASERGGPPPKGKGDNNDALPHLLPPPPPPSSQLYGCNVLNLGNSKIISVHAGTARSIVKHPSFRGDVQVIDFGPVTSMYGAVHCASQVVKRTPRQVPKA